MGARLYVVCDVDRFEGTLKCRFGHVISVGYNRVQNIDPDKVLLPTWTNAAGTSTASQTEIGVAPPTVSGSKWMLVPSTQGELGCRIIWAGISRLFTASSGGNATTGTDMKCRNQAHNESKGVVVNITAWTLGRENSLGVVVMMVLALTAVLASSCMSLWCLRVSRSVPMTNSLLTAASQTMKEVFEKAVKQMERGEVVVYAPPWTMDSSEMWSMPTPPSPVSLRKAESSIVYSGLGRRSGMRPCPLRTT